jgi:hypothetical protein
VELKNLFFTRTAWGIYTATLVVVSGTGIALAHKYDETKKLSVTDWVVAIFTVTGSLGAQGSVLVSKVASNGSLTYTPRGVWGPNREDLEHRVSPSFINDQLPMTNHQLPITSNQLPTTNHQLPVTKHQDPLPHYQLPITNNQRGSVQNIDGYRGE